MLANAVGRTQPPPTPPSGGALRPVTIAGGVVNVVLMVCKAVAGYLGHSTAMLADAAHTLGDLVWALPTPDKFVLSLAMHVFAESNSLR